MITSSSGTMGGVLEAAVCVRERKNTCIFKVIKDTQQLISGKMQFESLS